MPVIRVGIPLFSMATGAGGGVDTYAQDLLRAFAAHLTPGDQLTVVVMLHESAYPSWSPRDWPSFITALPLRSPSLADRVALRMRGALRRPLGGLKPGDLYQEHIVSQIDGAGVDLLHYPKTLAYADSRRIPIILTFFDIQHEYYPEFFTKEALEFRARTYRSMAERAAHLIVPSQHTRMTLIERYGIPEEKMTVVPVGVPASCRRAGPDEVDRVRVKYGLPEQFLFYPANPSPHKNHARLMAALRIMKDRHGTPPRLVMSGRLPNEPHNALWLAVAAGVEEWVTDLGFVASADLPALYSAATAMVFPSLYEGFGIPLLEAMACGCPIAAADATAIPECVGRAALLFDPFSPAAMADAIERLLSEDALRQSLAAEGYRQVEAYRWESLVPRIVDVYRRVLRA